MKKIVVDPERCIRCGACVSICDEVFDFSEEGFAITKEENNILDKMEENVKDDALDALEGCPTGAIKEIEENKNIKDDAFEGCQTDNTKEIKEDEKKD